MKSSPPIIHVLGTVGSGKGTQVALLAKKYGMPSISAGDLFRGAAAQPTAFGHRVRGILRSGELMPIDIWDEVIAGYLEAADFSRGYLLDGVVRTLEQVEHFGRLAKERSLPEPWALAIDLDEDIAFERILNRGRADTDTEAATRKRLTWSREQTQPVIEHFRSQERLVDVDGNQPVDAVQMAIVVALTAIDALPEAIHG